MAKKANTTPFNAAAMSNDKKHVAELLKPDSVAHILAGCMEQMHGGQWRVSIDHEALMIIISPKPGTIDGKIRRPVAGALV